MAAPTEIYVDPSGAADSGSGTIGDPYLDLQYALNSVTRDATNGDRFNIKSGTDEVLSSALSLATYGTPTAGAPIIFQGYTSSAGDGGIGGISGGGSVSIMAATNYVAWIDLHLHNTGANYILGGGSYIIISGCEFDSSSTGGINSFQGGSSYCINSYFHNISGPGIGLSNSGRVMFCTFENGASDFTNAITLGFWSAALFNVIDIDGSSNGIYLSNGGRAVVIGNSIYSNGGTGQGVQCLTGSGFSIVLNNIVEGFSGAGGVGFTLDDCWIAANNAAYNNTTNYSKGDIIVDDSNDALGASPFTDAANGDFTVDTTVKALAFPTANYPGLSVRSYLDIGALQRQEPAGGGDPVARPGLHAIEQGIAA